MQHLAESTVLPGLAEGREHWTSEHNVSHAGRNGKWNRHAGVCRRAATGLNEWHWRAAVYLWSAQCKGVLMIRRKENVCVCGFGMDVKMV